MSVTAPACDEYDILICAAASFGNPDSFIETPEITGLLTAGQPEMDMTGGFYDMTGGMDY